MTELMNKKDQTDLSFVRIIACDKANEIMELFKQGRRSSRYDDQIFDHLEDYNGEGKFFLSSKIDRYVQTDDTKAEKQDSEPYFLLSLDELPICLIRTEVNEDPDQKWDYYDYPVSDSKCCEIFRTGRFCILNASNYGLYLIGENDYYPLSGSPFEEENFFEQVKKLDITFDEKIERYELDPDHVGNIDVSISEYDYSPSEEDLSNIKRFMEDNGEYSDDYSLVGPVPQYQYGFTSLDQIDVRDLDRENGCLCFKLVKGNEVTGYVHYDPYDDGSESQIDSEINEADKTEKDINKYYAHLSPIGYIFADKIVEENEDDPDHSPLNRMVAEKIRMKIKEEERKFGVYQF
ncbi:MAG: hypothetical protein IJI41_10465 [Anaerolineaceae bacterium]|nr:hypothetical protein [Anaerolineaceae bacterium]MBQ6492932.1 hypothetical protein [Erysipelotrichaceae bacterium]